MQIRTCTDQSSDENSYIIFCPKNRFTLVIDPGAQYEKILNILSSIEAKVIAVLNTHGHIDHTFGNAYIKEKYQEAKIVIHKLDNVMLKESYLNLAEKLYSHPKISEADIILEGDCRLSIAHFEVDVIHTPGHTAGSVCFFVRCPHEADEKGLFTGDTIFKNSIGRTDLPHSCPDLMLSSLQKIIKLPDETTIFPGHGQPTTVSLEKTFNQFLKS